MKYLKFLFVIAILSVISYIAVSGVWSWKATFDLAHDALESPYEPLSVGQINSLIKIEDEHFFSHQGVDFSSGPGRTTITMAVADMVYFEGPELNHWMGKGQSFFKKMRSCCARFDISDYIRGLVLNWRLTKDEQLRIFTSNVYMGQFEGKPVFGFPSAALVYFKTRLEQLNDEQWLSLVAMVKDPMKYHPQHGAGALQQRLVGLQQRLDGLCKPLSQNDDEMTPCYEELELSNQEEFEPFQ